METSLEHSSFKSAPGESQISAHESAYLDAIKTYGAALARLARGYEADADRRMDLLQDIQVAVWQSLVVFDGRCSLRTWVYRVAHITATKHLIAHRRVRFHELHSLDEVSEPIDQHDLAHSVEQESALERLLKLIERLKPLDKQVILLYLEDFSAEDTAEVVGLSSENVATKIHRIKKLLRQMFCKEARHD
jgi:RNA polymerase sigma-70 factor (ECF subfamily)